MSRPCIAFFGLEPWEQDYIRARLKGNMIFFKEYPSKAATSKIRDVEILSAYSFSEIDKATLSKFKRLKFIATISTGIDHIDLTETRRRRIIVSNVPTYGENTVAEHTFALILAVSRKIPQSYERTIRSNFSLEGLRGFDLKGKTLGVVGTGHIGQHVIRIARGFEMDVLAYDVSPRHSLAETLGFNYTSFDRLLKNSDIITFHVPLTAKTRHMINQKNISKIKKGAIIVNTARGAVIETRALLEGLHRGIIGGAGLDVLEEEALIRNEGQYEEYLIKRDKLPSSKELETLLQNTRLLHYPNVVITPHNAFNSKEALQRILDTTISNIEAYLRGKPENTV